MASRGASLFAFFFCNEKKKGRFGVQPHELPHKPKGGAKGLKFGKWYAIKRKQGEKCYFSPCALISKSYQMPYIYKYSSTVSNSLSPWSYTFTVIFLSTIFPCA